MKRLGRIGLAAVLAWLCWLPGALSAANTNVLVWNQSKDQVTADVRDWDLVRLLGEIAGQTGWHVFVEPDAGFKASVKFKELPSRQALRQLLGDLNYAFVPQTNAVQQLYVFRTSLKNATQQVAAANQKEVGKAKRVPNELIVRVKPGTDIKELARRLGAKIVGEIPELNAYRLQFEDETATEQARALLSGNPDVVSVENNYYVDPPTVPQSLTGLAAPDTKLNLNPPKTDACKVVVGFVDTTLQKLSPELEAFITDRISAAGPVAVDNASPTHATAMLNAFFQALQASGNSSPSLRVIAADVFGASSSANSFLIAKELIDLGNRGATIINASLGGYGDTALLRDAVQQLADHNIPVVAAVGNDGSTQPFFPAAYPQVISVTAVERGKVAAYANVGTQPDAAAPGAVIFSFNSQVYGSRGTSVSSAVATGVAAGTADANCAPWSQVIPSLEQRLAVPAP
jgi:hypothetical protein